MTHAKCYYQIYWIQGDGTAAVSPIYSQTTLPTYAFKQVGADPDFSGGGNYFVYNNKIYINYSSQLTSSFDSWDPITNQWTQLPIPAFLLMTKSARGNLINNTIYFEPTSFSAYLVPVTDPNYREYLVTYTPQTGKWKTLTLNDTTVAGGAGIKCYTSFVSNNKFYCVIQETHGTANYPTNSNVIKVFDPSDNSWTKVMDINTASYAGGFNAVTLNNKIYLLATTSAPAQYGYGVFNTSFFELDLTNKTLIPKSIFSGNFTSILEPYLFTYNNKIYLWGGMGYGYSGISGNGFLVYDPPTDSWTVSGIPGLTGADALGFAFVVNNKVYIGLGESGGNWTNAIYNVDL